MAFISKKEEKWNVITHLLAGVISLIGLIYITYLAAIRTNMVILIGVIIYGFSLIALFTCSTLLHFSMYKGFSPKAQKIFRLFDHSAIYVLIAGTYTPFLLLSLPLSQGLLYTGIIWILATAGVTYQILYLGKHPYISTGLYVLMGWLVIFIAPQIYTFLSPFSFWLLVTGGVLYTVGALFYSIKKEYMHVIWHLFVMGGALSMYIAIINVLI